LRTPRGAKCAGVFVKAGRVAVFCIAQAIAEPERRGGWRWCPGVQVGEGAEAVRWGKIGEGGKPRRLCGPLEARHRCRFNASSRPGTAGCRWRQIGAASRQSSRKLRVGTQIASGGEARSFECNASKHGKIGGRTRRAAPPAIKSGPASGRAPWHCKPWRENPAQHHFIGCNDTQRSDSAIARELLGIPRPTQPVSLLFVICSGLRGRQRCQVPLFCGTSCRSFSPASATDL
jgi:hypothetical protein